MTEDDWEALIRRGFGLSSSLPMEGFVDVLSGHFPGFPREALRGIYKGFCSTHAVPSPNPSQAKKVLTQIDE